jgi:crotonobetainyl-CoA:carnitine CoA-transferase CaiB-like acyl-CoA transferase
MTTEGALTGVRILDGSTLMSAPQISALLADMGADVVQLEPKGGDPLRRMGVQRDGRSLMWAMVGRNKRSLPLDIANSDSRPLFERLVRWADVFVENYPPEVAAKRACTYDDLVAINPSIIVVSVSCYGRSGPYGDRPGAGTIAEAYGGLTQMTGDADGPPMLSSIPLGDGLAALSGAMGVLAALYHRDARGGRGQHVDVSMYEPILHLMNGTITGWDPKGPAPARTGSRVPGGVPRNTYQCADGSWVAVSGTTDNQVGRMLSLTGHDSDEDRARFGTSAARLQAADELDALVAAWVRKHTREEVVDALLRAKIPVSPVNTVPDLLADPHVGERGSVVTVDDPDMGELHLVPAPTRLDGTPVRITHAGPALAAGAATFLRDQLGLSAEEIDGLCASGVLDLNTDDGGG